MTPERTAGLVRRWVRFYTRKLPISIARRRIEEIAADLHDQIAHERAQGRGERRIALCILSRAGRGLPADISWRDQHAVRASYRSTLGLVLAVGLILLVPLVAMQFSDEVVWDPADFAVAGTLLLGTALLVRGAARRVRRAAAKAALGVAIGSALLLVWVTLAVGVIGSEDNPANLVILGVLALLLLGSAWRFRRATQTSCRRPTSSSRRSASS